MLEHISQSSPNPRPASVGSRRHTPATPAPGCRQEGVSRAEPLLWHSAVTHLLLFSTDPLLLQVLQDGTGHPSAPARDLLLQECLSAEAPSENGVESDSSATAAWKTLQQAPPSTLRHSEAKCVESSSNAAEVPCARRDGFAQQLSTPPSAGEAEAPSRCRAASCEAAPQPLWAGCRSREEEEQSPFPRLAPCG